MAAKGAQPRSKKSLAEARRKRESIVKEIWLFVVLAISLLLFLCNFKILGVAGNAVSSVLFGLFGINAYVFALALFFGFAFMSCNDFIWESVRPVIAGSVILLMAGVVFELISGNAVNLDHYSLPDIYRYDSGSRAGGGIISGSVAYFLHKFIGTVGTVIIAVLAVLVCVIVITQRSIIGTLRKGGSAVATGVRRNKESFEERRARAAEEYAARKALEEEQEAEMQAARRQTDEFDTIDYAPLRTRSGSRRAEALSPDESVSPDPSVERPARNRIKVSAAQRREDRDSARVLHNYSGVTTDTTLGPVTHRPKPATVPEYDIHEITGIGSEYREYESLEGDNEYARSGDRNSGPDSLDATGETNRTGRTGSIGSVDSSMAGSDSTDSADSIEESIEEIEEIEAIGLGRALKALGDGEVPYEQDYPEARSEQEVAPIREFKSNKSAKTPSAIAGPVSAREHERDLSPVPGIEPERNLAPVPGIEPEFPAVDTADEQEAHRDTAADYVYELPPLDLLKKPAAISEDSQEELDMTSHMLEDTLATFGVNVTVTGASRGPTVTRYELQPERGVKVAKIVGLADDIKLNLAATDIRIEAPIPGKSAVGIEVPNIAVTPVMLRELLESKAFRESQPRLSFAVGKDIGGRVVVSDIAKMPHVLIAGATGSGKSVCINTLIMSILYKSGPQDVRLIMIDPKVVELSVYNGIPHLLIPVVTDPKKATGALQWAVAEMEERYKKFAMTGTRDLAGYNKNIPKLIESGVLPEDTAPLPQILIIVDELADLMMVASKDVEEAICRLAQLARAAGLHLVIATQRPSVDVITGLIKANMPSRIAFAVSSGVDSRTILDSVGAEKLLGKGDMLFYPQGYSKPARLQGAFVSDDEVQAVVDWIKDHAPGPGYDDAVEEHIASAAGTAVDTSGAARNDAMTASGVDELFIDACKAVSGKDKASIGGFQRAFRIGFNRAARIMDSLTEYGVVAQPDDDNKPRKVIMTPDEIEELIDSL